VVENKAPAVVALWRIDGTEGMAHRTRVSVFDFKKAGWVNHNPSGFLILLLQLRGIFFNLQVVMNP